MLFRQLMDPARGCASYLLGCPRSHAALVVDPLAALGLEAYLAEAADLGLSIDRVVDTHLHADHRTLGPDLAAELDVPYSLHDSARNLVRHRCRFLSDGDELDFGALRVRVLHTPGHTPDSISLLVTDRSRSDEPWLLLSGDTLLVGDVGRPDLIVGDPTLDVWDAEERAMRLYHSIHDRLLPLPDYVEVYPGHFGGSACGGIHMSGKAASTIGFERRFNLALQRKDAVSFRDFVAKGLKPQPEAFATIKRANLGLGEA